MNLPSIAVKVGGNDLGPYYWCRRCRHHLTAHRLADGRAVCEGCDSRHNPIWARLEDSGRKVKSYHEYAPGNHLTAWLSRNERQWGPALFFCAIIVVLVVVGRML